ncbi:alanine racemase [Flexithrix dorotheae]|uniref:alanine racemase n=1 Tax=Flexithrix dorotheae TaxID=70993 RepID=UPI0003764E9A|nr:alanine racemase [Flexithrix dorotheae]
MALNIIQPTLLLDKQKALNNIKRMSEKARLNGMAFTPHFKTHQSAEIASWYKTFGVSKIKVSSLKMARYFAKNGWENIVLAFPLNILEIPEINELAQKVKLDILIVNKEALIALKNQLTTAIGFYIEIDTGYHRTGIPPREIDLISTLIRKAKENQLLHFQGFYCHAGHSYHLDSPEDFKLNFQQSLDALNHLKSIFIPQNKHLKISFGDTPFCSVFEQFKGVDEFGPGNFVFYDLTQQKIGSCHYENIAVAMACPVIAIYPERNQIVVHGGGVHFAKDFLVNKNGQAIYGKVAAFAPGNPKGWGKPIEDIELTGISQEHGTLSATNAFISKTKIGDILSILPVHSCMTANAMGEYLTLDGEKLKMMK